jgi:hypothetical protein
MYVQRGFSVWSSWKLLSIYWFGIKTNLPVVFITHLFKHIIFLSHTIHAYLITTELTWRSISSVSPHGHTVACSNALVWHFKLIIFIRMEILDFSFCQYILTRVSFPWHCPPQCFSCTINIQLLTLSYFEKLKEINISGCILPLDWNSYHTCFWFIDNKMDISSSVPYGLSSFNLLWPWLHFIVGECCLHRKTCYWNMQEIPSILVNTGCIICV